MLVKKWSDVFIHQDAHPFFSLYLHNLTQIELYRSGEVNYMFLSADILQVMLVVNASATFLLLLKHQD